MNQIATMQSAGAGLEAQTDNDAGGGAPFGALIAALDARRVEYCHWKSNVRLDETLAGDEDFDVLVRREDAAAFFAALSDADFRLAQGAAGHPGVLHAFALDPATLRLAHVHAYFQVVSGDSLVKSYRLPIETLLLAGSRRERGVRVPAPEAELVVFLIRIALKHTGPIETWMANRHYRAVPPELAWLRDRADEAAARALWAETVPQGSGDEFDALMAAVADPARLAERVRLGVGLAWRLRGWRRLGMVPATISRSARLLGLVRGRLVRRRSRHLAAGGAIIALVGPKASGKSTLGAALADRLGKQLDVRRIHVGKPPATWPTAPVQLVLPLLRRAMPGERSGEYQRPERRARHSYSWAHVVRMLLLAHDRRALLRRSRRAATHGAILVADRYPASGAGGIDSSQFGEAAIAACTSRAKRALMRLESRLYRDLPRPDLVIRLIAPIETTLQRDASRSKREGPDPDSVLRRRELETALDFPDVPVLTVNSDAPLEQTVSEVVRGVWQRL